MSDIDQVLAKLSNLENGQARLEDKVGRIGDAIWQQDTGLFARVAANTTARKIGTWVMTFLSGGLLAVLIKVFLP